MTDRHAQKVSYPLRMPDDLREKLESSAKSNNRSMNSEIVARLQDSFKPQRDEQLTTALTGQVSAYKALLRRAAGSIQMALVRGKEHKIPAEDVRWLEDEYREIHKLASDE